MRYVLSEYCYRIITQKKIFPTITKYINFYTRHFLPLRILLRKKYIAKI